MKRLLLLAIAMACLAAVPVKANEYSKNEGSCGNDQGLVTAKEAAQIYAEAMHRPYAVVGNVTYHFAPATQPTILMDTDKDTGPQLRDKSADGGVTVTPAAIEYQFDGFTVNPLSLNANFISGHNGGTRGVPVGMRDFVAIENAMKSSSSVGGLNTMRLLRN